MTKKLVFAFFALCAIDLILALVFQSALIMIIGCLCAGILVSNAKRLKFNNGGTIVLAYTVSCIVMVILYYGYMDKYGAPYYLGGSDDLDFEVFSAKYAEQKSLNYFAMVDDLTYQDNRTVGNGFIYLFALFRALVEPIAPYHTVVFRIINIHLLLIGALLLTAICRRKQNNNRSKAMAKESCLFLAVALYPNVVYISAHVFRDTICLLILCYVIYDITHIKKGSFIHAIVLGAIMYFVRPDYLIIVAGTYVYSIYVVQDKKWMKRLILLLGGIGILVIGLQFNIIELIKTKFGAYNNSYLTQGDGIGTAIFSIPLFPFGIFVRMLYAFVTPLPYQIFEFSFEIERLMIAYRAFGTCFFLYLLPYYFIRLKKMDLTAILSLVYLAIICSMTFTFRHFVIFHPLAIAVAYSEMLQTKKEKKQQYALISTMVLCFFFVVMLAL